MSSPKTPLNIWLITDGLPGNETQIRGLEADLRKLGADVELKSLRSNRWHVLGAALLGGSGLSIKFDSSDPLQAPWPDFVIGTGRRSGPWVRYVKRASGGKTKAVMFGQKGANYMAGLDRGFVLKHWNFPAHPNRKSALLPPSGVTLEQLGTAKTKMPDLLDPNRAPWLLLVVGGRCFDHAFEPEDAIDIASRAASEAKRLGGSLAIITSRRSGAAVEKALLKAAPNATFFPASMRPSPLYALFAQTNAAIITGDSESMIAESIAANLPTYIASVRPRWSLRMAIERCAWALYCLGGPLAWLITCLWKAGVIMPPRSLSAMANNLVSAQLAHLFDGMIDVSAKPKPSSNDFMKYFVDRH